MDDLFHPNKTKLNNSILKIQPTMLSRLFKRVSKNDSKIQKLIQGTFHDDGSPQKL